MILPIIAWRNVWRSKIRSLVVIISIFLGVWALICMMSFTSAMVNDYVDNAIRYQTAHLQIHHPDFVEDQELKYTLSDGEQIYADLKTDDSYSAVSIRTVVNGMIKSSRGAQGMTIRGIEPEAEKALSRLDEKLLEGKFLNAEKKNQILISQELAEKLGLKLRKKIVLQFQDRNGDITAGSFRVAGIYKTGNTVFDLSSVLVNRSDLNRLIGTADAVHEIAIMLKEASTLADQKAAIAAAYPNALVEDYREISPDIKLYEQQIGISLMIFGTIFMLALIFGIINTMLMAVLERTRELGVLMAVGMNKARVFGMILLETLILGLVGAPIGLIAGYCTVEYFGNRGIDLGAFAEGIERFGMSTMIYPQLDSQIYLQLMFAVIITSVIAALYPARKATKLKPLEAIRKI